MSFLADIYEEGSLSLELSGHQYTRSTGDQSYIRSTGMTSLMAAGDQSYGPHHSTATSSNRSSFADPLPSFMSDLSSERSSDSGIVGSSQASGSLPGSRSSLPAAALSSDYSHYSSYYSENSLTSSDLGPRPQCDGKEATPTRQCMASDLVRSHIRHFMLRKHGRRTEHSKLCLSGLDTDWDNSDCDATCSTCYTDGPSHYISSLTDDLHSDISSDSMYPQHHVAFMRHLFSCHTCTSGEPCATAAHMEASLPNFFEFNSTLISKLNSVSRISSKDTDSSSLKADITFQDSIHLAKCKWSRKNESTRDSSSNSVHYRYNRSSVHRVSNRSSFKSEDSHSSNLRSHCGRRKLSNTSILTACSDSSNFMLASCINKTPVTSNRERTNHIGKKLKKIGRYIRNIGQQSSIANSQFKTITYL